MLKARAAEKRSKIRAGGGGARALAPVILIVTPFPNVSRPLVGRLVFGDTLVTVAASNLKSGVTTLNWLPER